MIIVRYFDIRLLKYIPSGTYFFTEDFEKISYRKNHIKTFGIPLGFNMAFIINRYLIL